MLISVEIARAAIEMICNRLGKVSTYRNLTSTTPHVRELTPQDFVHDIRPGKDGGLFTPAITSGSRGNESFETASGINFDFDKGDLTPEEIQAAFPDRAMLIYSTHNHTRELPRYRAVLPLSRAVSAGEQQLIGRALLHGLPDRLKQFADTGSVQRARAHYLPSCPPGIEPVLVAQGGESLDADALLQAGVELAVADTNPSRKTPTNSQRAGDDFNSKHTVEEVLNRSGWIDLGRGGYWGKPGSDGREKHAAVYGDKVHVFSSAAPVPGDRSYDAFGLYVFSDYGGDFTAATKAAAEHGYGAESVIDWAALQQTKERVQLTATQQEHRGTWPPCIDMVKLSQERPYPPRFIIPGWLPAGYATLFAGHGGIGKSGLALMIAVCIALGLLFCGLPIQRKTVLYLSCEDREGVLHWRLLRICEYLGVSMADLNGWLHVVDLVGHEVILFNGATAGRPLTPAYDELRNLISRQGAEVLFVDGIGDTYSGNENSRAEVKAFVNALLALIPPDDGAVVLVGHVAKLSANTRTAEGYSGSTAWHNSVRARWYLYPESNVFDGRAEKTGDLLLELQKSNLGAADLSLRFGWDDAAGLFINKESAPGQGQDQAADEQAELDGILAALRACPTYVPAARQGSHTAYHTLSVCPEFPPSLLQGTAGKKRFWRRIEQLARIRAIEESSMGDGL